MIDEPFCMQEPVVLLEYSLNVVTEGIDAIASTRVLICGGNGHTATHALIGEAVQQTFRYGLLMIIYYFGVSCSFYRFLDTSKCFNLVVMRLGQVWISSVRAYIATLNKMLGFKEESRLA